MRRGYGRGPMRRVLLVAVLLTACSAGGGRKSDSDALPAPAGVPRPYAVRGAAETPETTTTATRPAPPARASRGGRPPRPRVSPAPGSGGGPAIQGDVFDRLAACESGMRQNAVGGGGRYLSYFQWSLSTWHAAGGTGDPRNVDYATQKAIAMRWAQRSNPYGQWPTCWPRVVGR